ncbi:TPA: HNH endonuclease [Serratia marcescens]|uniref:hypothetical protein n=2 Tax=Serratia TaxID=613 RepID=UPI001A260A3D|nr:HNH endonuclease [Serratia marcescens]
MCETKKDFCYLSGDLITDDNKTVEHIIPNALNGHLTSNKILTSKSNMLLGETIDSKFDEIFDIFTSQLGFRRDRGRNPNFTVTDITSNEKYVLSNSKISPVKPYFDTNNSLIYAKDKKKYNQIYNKIKSGKIPNIGFIDDKTGLYNYHFNIKNKEFKQGIAKIAAGFATLNEIQREDLCMALDLENKRFLDKPHIVPFIALSDIDKIIESKIDVLSLFPYHSLIIHGNKSEKLLYCYVELFSTFQYIALLNDNYSGDDVYIDYFYSLSKDTAFEFNDYINEVKEKITPDFNKNRYREINLNYVREIVFIANYNYDKYKKYGHLKFHALMNYANKIVHDNK